MKKILWIDKQGSLWTERAGKRRLQLCPYVVSPDSLSDERQRPCGDWCPHFREPIVTSVNQQGEAKGTVVICGDRAISGIIEDERLTK